MVGRTGRRRVHPRWDLTRVIASDRETLSRTVSRTRQFGANSVRLRTSKHGVSNTKGLQTGHFKTGRAGQPLAWKVRFLRRVVAGNERSAGTSIRIERVRRPVWYAKYRLPDGRQVQKKIGPAFAGADVRWRGRSRSGQRTRGSTTCPRRHVAESCPAWCGRAQRWPLPSPSGCAMSNMTAR
jgi:hypothetical protein